MTQLDRTQLKTNSLFNESQELRELSCRFSKETLNLIQEISEANGISKAEVVRRLVNHSIKVKQR